MTRPDVSVLLVSWNTCAQTRQCLASLPDAAAGAVGYEVIAVDNASSDGSAEMLAACQDIQLIRNDVNRGFAAAVNQAYARARADLILLLNSDVRCHPGSLRTLVRFLADAEQAAGVAPLYLNPDGSRQQHYLDLPGFRAALALGTALRFLPGFRGPWRAYRMRGEDFSVARPVPQPSASCLLLRRLALEPQRIFDERLPIYFNDVLLARELAARGHQLWMTPEAVVTHSLGASTRLLGEAARSRQHLGGLVHYLRLTQPRHRVRIFQTATFIDRLARQVLARPGRLGLHDVAAALRGDLGQLPDGDRSPWVVMFSGVGWSEGTTGEHRQHALARELACEQRVLFVDPPGSSPRWRCTIRPIATRLWQARPTTLLPFGRQLPPVNRINRRFATVLLRHWLDRAPGRRLLWLDEDLSVVAVARLGADRVLYDIADLDWTFTRRWNRWHLRGAMRRAAGTADLVVLSSTALRDALPPTRRPPVVVPNGCDPTRFCPDGPRSAWIDRLPGPRLGYAGAIDTRAFDGELLAEVARRRPAWTFVLIGRVTRSGAGLLDGLPNVHLMGAIDFADVPGALRSCDACLIPYRLGALIDYVHPKKLYEYLALGKPVIATPLPALSELADVIHLAAGPDEFTDAIERALESGRDHVATARRRATAVANSWSSRGRYVRALVAELQDASR